ncbi:hypothetical protein [Vibrio crassostreae]|uniref:hypothetical protein n=1 Tax=Vibrio crassostreae TaxID=246167 RepID=UPI001BD23C82|nr:hypothetical protein [Vibrio crassostreae]
MEEFQTILFGVLSGVITALLIFCASLTIKRIIIPWYQRLVYRGVDISGEWNGRLQHLENVYFEVSLELQQSAHNINGTYTSIKYRDGEYVDTSTMKVSGEVWEGFLTLQCRTVSNKRLSFGAILLKVNTDVLTGMQVFRNLNSRGRDIIPLEVNLIRK